MFKNMSIKKKVILLVLVPSLFLLLISYTSIMRDYNNVTNLKKLNIGVNLVNKVSFLVHETQKERGLTSGFLGSKGEKHKEKLSSQRDLTNKRYEELSIFIKNNDISSLSSSLNESLSLALNKMKKISDYRQKISSLLISRKEAISYYTNMNAGFLSIVPAVTKISNSPKITQQLFSYSNFLLSKERAGIERAIGASTLTNDGFAEGMKTKFTNLISAQNSYMDNFLEYASLPSLKYYKNTLQGKEVDEVNKIRNTMLLSDKKFLIISKMKEIVGYGGLIHNFKNYIIRSDNKYNLRIQEDYSNLQKNINKYKSLKNVSPEEIKLLDKINSVFSTYYNGLEKIKNAFNENMSVQQLDKVLKVSDNPAVKALQKLSHSLFSVKSEYWFSNITHKINLLKKIDDSLSKELSVTINSELTLSNNSLYFVIIETIIAIFAVIFLGVLFTKSISSSLEDFKESLLSFFKYLNKENTSVSLLAENNNTEIGQMSIVVNENIKKTEKNIEEEKDVISKTIILLKDFEEGDLSQRINVQTSNAALAELTKLLNKMANNFERNIDGVLKVLDEYSNYNYMNKIDTSGTKAHLEKLANGVNALGDSVTGMLVYNKRIGVTLNSSSDTLLSNVDILNKSSNEAATSLEETAAALEEITSTIINNTNSINQMSKYASLLNESTKHGQKLANETMNSMDEINEQVSAINDAISVIDQIAFQTNILSLNAAVEAATAGEAGKGFAVVAQEVRNLASRSAEAAKEIKDLVMTANDKAAEGKKISSTMIDGYFELNDNITKTIELIKTVETSSKEQQTGIEQINDAVSKQDQQTQKIATAANETYDIAINTSGIAKKIVESSDEKEFMGKDEVSNRRDFDVDLNYKGNEKRETEKSLKKIRHRDLPQNVNKSFVKKEKIISTNVSSNSAKFEDSSNKEEWESF